MKIKEIFNLLNEISPFVLQEEWDNSGLLVGNLEDEIKNIYISLDIDLQTVKNLEPNSLLITHHPLIFKPLKRLNFNSYPTTIIKEMIKKDISLISMHTNFDKTHLNSYVAREILGEKEIEIDEFFCYFDKEIEFDNYLEVLKKAFKLEHIKYVKADEKISKVALTTGSGGDLIKNLKANCFLTGDIKYHQALEAKENGISLIDIGHFESEIFFANCLDKELQKNGVLAIITNSLNPFEIN